MIGRIIRFLIVAAMVFLCWAMFANQSSGWIVVAGFIVAMWLFFET